MLVTISARKQSAALYQMKDEPAFLDSVFFFFFLNASHISLAIRMTSN